MLKVRVGGSFFGGGWAKWRGGQKSFELPKGGTKKFSAVDGGGGGQNSLVKLKV